jgi:hypothetical protein
MYRSNFFTVSEFEIRLGNSLILYTLTMEPTWSSKTFLFTRATRRDIPEDGSLRSHRRENLKSYIALTVWAL